MSCMMTVYSDSGDPVCMDRLHVLRVWACGQTLRATMTPRGGRRCEGPHSEAEASQLVAAVQTAIEVLES